MTPLREMRNIMQVKLLYRPTDIFVQADKAGKHQVISNPLGNVFKFTKERSVSIITTERKEERDRRQYYLVSIKDTGTRIHPEILPRLFTKFATKSDTEGTDLGLFISNSIIEAHAEEYGLKIIRMEKVQHLHSVCQ